MTGTESLAGRVAALDWPRIRAELDSDGASILGPLLDPVECAALAGLFPQEAPFRRHIVMGRHGYGQGEYKYFAAPLPEPVAALRQALYPPLAGVANGWAEMLGEAQRYPGDLPAFLERGAAAGQGKPTPLLLRYRPGDYNRLHQDLYGETVFPLQVVVLLSEPGRDFAGGEFVLTEQRPRMQSRAEVLPLRQGEAAAFAVRQRPARGTRGVHRVQMRHGVSRLRGGERFTLGIIFHDAA